MNQLQTILFSLLGYEVCGTEIKQEVLDSITEDTLVPLYTFSKANDLAHLVADALIKLNKLDTNSEIGKKYNKQLMLSVYRYTNLQQTLAYVKTILEEYKIPFIPLKGSVLRTYYPQPWMRTSCDIDILIHEEDIEKAVNIIVKKTGCTASGVHSHDCTLSFQNHTNLELHYRLLEDARLDKANQILLDVWNHVEKDEGKEYNMHMSDEMFYFYHIAHAAKHFKNGGCGIRPFLDLWVLNHTVEHNEEARVQLLKQGNLDSFYNESCILSEKWFANNPNETELTSQFEKYILLGGVYGSETNGVVVRQANTNKFKYFLNRLFPKKDSMLYLFPILRKQAWLLPFCWIARWFRLLSPKRFKKAVNETKNVHNTNNDDVVAAENMLNQLKINN